MQHIQLELTYEKSEVTQVRVDFCFHINSVCPLGPFFSKGSRLYIICSLKGWVGAVKD